VRCPFLIIFDVAGGASRRVAGHKLVIEPDMRIARIRLSDKISRLVPAQEDRRTTPHGPARTKSQLQTRACVVGMRHTLMLPGIDAEMQEFGQDGIKRGKRELLAANADEIETVLTILKLRDDWQGREMAWHLQWLLLKAETQERRRSLFKF
jgi:hypothetical protein